MIVKDAPGDNQRIDPNLIWLQGYLISTCYYLAPHYLRRVLKYRLIVPVEEGVHLVIILLHLLLYRHDRLRSIPVVVIRESLIDIRIRALRWPKGIHRVV